MEKKAKYCSFCGSDLGEEIYTDEYVESLKQEISHLQDIQENVIGAKYITLKDTKTLLKGIIKTQSKDYLLKIIHIIDTD